MTYYIYHRNEEFIGVTPFQWVPLEGVSVIEVNDDLPDLNRVVWDPINMKLVRSNPILSKLDFMSRFTSSERIAIQNSTDPIIKDAFNLLQLSEFIDVTDQRTMMLVGYLAMAGLISNDRVAEILS